MLAKNDPSLISNTLIRSNVSKSCISAVYTATTKNTFTDPFNFQTSQYQKLQASFVCARLSFF